MLLAADNIFAEMSMMNCQVVNILKSSDQVGHWPHSEVRYAMAASRGFGDSHRKKSTSPHTCQACTLTTSRLELLNLAAPAFSDSRFTY